MRRLWYFCFLVSLLTTGASATHSAPTGLHFHVYYPDFTPKPGTLYGFEISGENPWYSLAIAPNGDVYYPDRNFGQIHFARATGHFNVVTYAFEEIQTPLGRRAVGVLLTAVDPQGRLYTDGGPGILGDVTPTSASSVISTPNAFSDMEFAASGRLYTADPGKDAAIVAIDDSWTQRYRLAARYVCDCDFLRIAIDARYVYAVDTMGRIYQFTPNLELLRTVDTASGEGAIRSIAPDSHGGVWFADRVAGQIGYVSAYGGVQRFTPPFTNAFDARVDMIATASDGTVWFVADGDSKLVSIDETGTMNAHSIPGLIRSDGNRGIYFKGTFGMPYPPSSDELVFQNGTLLVVTGI
jgi:streptogramin lyase